jgi:hypothetical protein
MYSFKTVVAVCSLLGQRGSLSRGGLKRKKKKRKKKKDNGHVYDIIRVSRPPRLARRICLAPFRWTCRFILLYSILYCQAWPRLPTFCDGLVFIAPLPVAGVWPGGFPQGFGGGR